MGIVGARSYVEPVITRTGKIKSAAPADDWLVRQGDDWLVRQGRNREMVRVTVAPTSKPKRDTTAVVRLEHVASVWWVLCVLAAVYLCDAFRCAIFFFPSVSHRS